MATKVHTSQQRAAGSAAAPDLASHARRDAAVTGSVRGSRAGAAVVLGAPVGLVLAIAYHPYIPRLDNSAEVARELEAGPVRWGLAHLAVGLAAALLLIAFLVVRSLLREHGDRWSGWGTPLVVLGSVLFAFLPAMEVAIVAVNDAGGDVAAAMEQLNTWFVPILISSSALFALGLAGFATGIATAPLGLSRGVVRMVVVALLVAALSRFVPLGAAIYVGAVALTVALWPLGLLVLREPEAEPVREA